MAFYEERLPTDISYLARGGMQFSTVINEQDNGFEYRNQNWSQTRGIWNISNALMTKQTIGVLGYYNLLNFFNAMRGRLHGFRFKDPNDFKAGVNSAVIGTGSMLGKPTYQLGKKYIQGSAIYIKDIFKPVNGTFKLYKNSILQSSGYTIDNTTGIITFTATSTKSCSIAIAISGVATVTSVAHGFTNGQVIYFTSSNSLVNNKTFTISNVTADTFKIVLNNAVSVTATALLYPQPIDNYTCEFEYDVPVRFDNDSLNAGMDEAGFISIDSITLIELRLKSNA